MEEEAKQQCESKNYQRVNAMGINEDRYRYVLGAKLADYENEDSRTVSFEELKDRGLEW